MRVLWFEYRDGEDDVGVEGKRWLVSLAMAIW